MNTSNTPIWKISIDTGGTFTDCLAIDPEGKTTRIKVLSSSRLRGRIRKKVTDLTYEFYSPWKYESELLAGYNFRIGSTNESAVLVAIDYDNNILTLDSELSDISDTDFELFSGEEAPVLAARLLTKTNLKNPLPLMEMRLGTTRGTNALLERKGAKTLLVVTKGFKDLLYIGNQQRPSLFQLNIPEPDLLYSDVIELHERIDADGHIIKELDSHDFSLFPGMHFESVAVSLLNSYQNDQHETAIASAFRQSGAKYVSASSQLFPFSHYLRRTQTAVINAYLDPVLDLYLINIKNSLPDGSLKIMTSTGSLSEVNGFRAKDSLLSGPAGGMVAATNTAKLLGFPKVLTFDMGGTSTDVARIDGQPELKYITEIDGIEFHNPTLAIETVAAGGGSVCWFDGFTLQVGPESAGASPGPACYGAGGPLTITDVNLLLGKMDPAKFGIPIRSEAALSALKDLQNLIFEKTNNLLSESKILTGLERIANEKMADAIRKISVTKGINPAEYALITFGGAGGLHSCQLADLLEIKNVIIPYDAGLFSAVGIGEALISALVSKQIVLPWELAESQITKWKDELLANAEIELYKQGITQYDIAFFAVFLRFTGQENTIEVPYEGNQTIENFQKSYITQFGYYPENSIVELESIKLKVQEKADESISKSILKNGKSVNALRQVEPLYMPENTINIETANLYEWDILISGDEITGPSILLNSTSTAYIPAGWKLVIQENKDAIAFKTETKSSRSEEYSDEVSLQLFTNRFKAIAEEMGVQLQRTAFSVNVKERLDFSLRCWIRTENCWSMRSIFLYI